MTSRRPLTSDVIRQCAAMLDEGKATATDEADLIAAVAKTVGITPYVAALVARENQSPVWRGRQHPPDLHPGNATLSRVDQVDEATVRAIRRAIEADWLPTSAIAHAFGVGDNTVSSVASGVVTGAGRVPVKWLAPGERVLHTAPTCPGCGHPLKIVPCRICAARRIRAARVALRKRRPLEASC